MIVFMIIIETYCGILIKIYDHCVGLVCIGIFESVCQIVSEEFIDSVNVTFCDATQINKILDNYCSIIPLNTPNPSKDIKVTPAALVHLANIIKDKHKIIECLNSKKVITDNLLETIVVEYNSVDKSLVDDSTSLTVTPSATINNQKSKPIEIVLTRSQRMYDNNSF